MDHLNPDLNLPTFGEQLPDIVYTYRPGSYGLIFERFRQRLAVVQTPIGYYLPGGGSNPGEGPLATLRREAREECGFFLRRLEQLCETIDFFKAVPSGRFYQIHSFFYTASLLRQHRNIGEADHILIWLTPEQAAGQLFRPSQSWVVRHWLEINAREQH